MRLLLAEDEQKMARMLKVGLEEQGYAVDVALNGEDAVDLGVEEPYDLVVLDVLLPGIDGYTVCRQLRAAHRQVPILMLTARDAVEDRVAGLDAGADDYLVKPFDPRELFARVRALLRRKQVTRDPVLRVADLEIDTVAREVRRSGRLVALTSREYSILELFARNPNRVLTREQIASHVWDYEFSGVSNVIDVYIGYLRRKLDDAGPSPLLRTVRGVGYQLKGALL
jgi:DNA-binding response OmpR family regulator